MDDIEEVKARIIQKFDRLIPERQLFVLRLIELIDQYCPLSQSPPQSSLSTSDL